MATNLWHSAEAIIIIWARFVSGLNTEFSLIKYRKINLPIERNNGFAYVVSLPVLFCFHFIFLNREVSTTVQWKAMCNKNQSRSETRKLAGYNPNILCETKKKEMPVNTYCSLSTTAAWRKHLNQQSPEKQCKSDELVNITFEYGFSLPAAVSQLNPGISPNLKTFVSKERRSL